MSLSQFDKDGTRLAILGSDGLLSIWQYIQGNAPTLSQKVNQSFQLLMALINTIYSLQPPHICQQLHLVCCGPRGKEMIKI